MATVECSGILFDLDGTLIDSGTAVQDAWTEFGHSVGRDPAKILEMCPGKRTTEVIELLNLDMPTRETAERVEGLIIYAGSKPVPGAVEFLKSLPQDCWAVVTSSMARTAWSRFELTELPEPQAIVSADDVATGKPDPACYLLGAEELSVEPAQCLVFEDAVAGIAAGRNAGMQVAALETTEVPSALTNATFVVPDFRAVRLAGAVQSATGTWTLSIELAEVQV